MNKVNFQNDFRTYGVPIFSVGNHAKISIGKDFVMNNGKYNNMIGRQQNCYFVVSRNAQLSIANNVGISAVAIVCWNKISIGSNVRIGGGTVIYDTDFHSLDSTDRLLKKEDNNKVSTSPVIIEEGVFIGANCTILKGVTIGSNAIIGACSVITKNVLANQIWAGNPAKFIRYVDK